ncbi:MAG: MFS transporter [Acidobacteriota bacterium]
MNPWKGLRGLRKEVWALSAATLVNRAGTMVLPFMVLYLTRSLGFSSGRAGLALTAYGLGGLLITPFAGRLSDRIGRLPILLGSLLGAGLFLLVFPLAHQYWAVLAMSFVLAVINESFRPAAMALVADVTTPEQRRPAFALYRFAVNLGMAVGPAAGGFLALVSFRFLFYADAATTLLAFGLLAFLSRKLGITRAAGRAEPSAFPPGKGVKIRPLRDGRFVYFLLALAPAVLVYFQLESAFPLFLVRHAHLPESAYGLFLTLNTVIIILLEIPLNTWMARWPHRRTLVLGAFLCGLGFGATGLTWGFWSVAATVVIWTFGEMIAFPSASAAVADLAPEGSRGAYMGVYTMSWGVCFSIGPWLGAQTLESFGPSAVWSGVFVLGCLSAFMLMFLKIPQASN